MLEPPITVARPAPATALPRAAAERSWQFTAKLDGVRAVLLRGPDKIRLRSRRNTDLTSEFTEIIEAAANLAPGTALDGEIIAWRGGRMEFTDLLRTPAARRAAGTVIGYAAFDALCIDDRDVRPQPLTTRWALLTTTLATVPLPIQAVLATDDRAEAEHWMTALAETGVEGIVARPWHTPYRPGTASGWLKIRTADTIDAAAIALLGNPDRPRSLLVRLPDGTIATTSPALPAPQARQLAAAAVAAGPLRHTGTARTDLAAPIAVEVRATRGRHGRIMFVRIRRDD